MTIQVLHERGQSKRAIARQLGISEGAVRYRLREGLSERPDGRAKRLRAEACAEAIRAWVDTARERGEGLNLAALHEFLVSEHGYGGSLRSVQRYVAATFPRPKRRARRRVETPPGAQGQADWAVWPGVWVGGAPRELYSFHLALSWSRAEAVVWSERKDLLAWLACHNGALRRLGGVPAVVRVDNERTAAVRGAGPWGERHPAYAAYARAVRFHIDLTRPRAPEAKGKVERRIGDARSWLDPRRERWRCLEELQGWTDERCLERASKRRSPMTGTSVAEALVEERRWLGPLPELPEPFDLVQRRRVAEDATVRFEGRSYSVPFVWLDREVEVRGCTRSVQVWAQGKLIAEHPRHTRERVVIDWRHYEGPGDDRISEPTPLGRLGRRLVEIGALPPERRPLDLYAALAEVAR